jgi:hypothetical protein
MEEDLFRIGQSCLSLWLALLTDLFICDLWVSFRSRITPRYLTSFDQAIFVRKNWESEARLNNI